MSSEVRDTSLTLGSGRTGILLLHRLCGTPVEMRFVAQQLAHAGYRVSCPLLAGHGGSVDMLANSQWTDWYASAERALADLQKTCDTIIVGGLSTGAVLATLLAARHPKTIQGTMLLAPTLWLNGWMVPWYARLFRLVKTKGVAKLFKFQHHAPYGIKDTRIRDFLTRARTSGQTIDIGHPTTPGGALFEHGRLVKAVCNEAQSIAQPSLILHPREDDYADLNNALYLKQKFSGSVDLTVLDDCYHLVTVDRQRQLVADKMLAFMANIAAKFADCAAPAPTRRAA